MPRPYVFRPQGGNQLTRFLGALRPGAELIRAPCLAYVVRHPGAGQILIDTGFHPDASENLRKDFGVRMALFFRSVKPADLPYEKQLQRTGVDPGEVGSVVMTHLHVDHTGGTRLLPNARFLCATQEWRAATRKGAAAQATCAQSGRG